MAQSSSPLSPTLLHMLHQVEQTLLGATTAAGGFGGGHLPAVASDTTTTNTSAKEDEVAAARVAAALARARAAAGLVAAEARRHEQRYAELEDAADAADARCAALHEQIAAAEERLAAARRAQSDLCSGGDTGTYPPANVEELFRMQAAPLVVEPMRSGMAPASFNLTRPADIDALATMAAHSTESLAAIERALVARRRRAVAETLCLLNAALYFSPPAAVKDDT